MGEAMDDVNEMVGVVVCSCYVWGGGVGVFYSWSECGSVRTTYYQYVIETCRGHNY